MTLWEAEPDDFYMKYLAENRPARMPQTEPMSVGSAFDAYVKAELHEALFGAGADPEYELRPLFDSQVEEHNRDWAWKAGEYCFDRYKFMGAYDELLKLLEQSIEDPRFECKLNGVLGALEVPFTGKPDCRFVLDLGQGRISVVLDWKVKGFCSKSAPSPSKGYMLCRDAYEPIPNAKGVPKSSQSHEKSHKLYMEHDFRGLTINRDYMENCSKDYADQCSLYGWLLGEPVGSEALIFIDELICKPTGNALEGQYPLLRIANHRARVKPEYQQKLIERVESCWSAVTSGHIFPDVSREESDLRIKLLDDVAIGLASDGSPEEDFFSEVVRPQTYKR
jgi:hypothetical protein